MEKVKLLLVAPVPPPYGGIGNWVLLMKEYLSKQSEVELVDIINIAPKQRGLDGRTWYDRIVGQGMEMFRLCSQLKKSVKKHRPTTVHITTSGQLAIIRDILFLKLLKKLSVKSVYHIHFGRIPDIVQKNTTEWKLLKIALSLATTVMTIDCKTQEVLEKQIGKNKIVLIANPFDMKKTQKYQGCQTSKTVMFLGWCVQTKGIEELLAAWKNIEKQYSDWTLKIVGPYDARYKMELEQKYPVQNVVFEGEKEHDQAMNLLSQSEVFILPSYTEGFPNSVLEAMALGKAIIATDVGAIPDMLADESGIIIKSKNSAQVECALKSLMEDERLRKRLGENAYIRIKNEYDIDVIFDKYQAAWRGD